MEGCENYYKTRFLKFIIKNIVKVEQKNEKKIKERKGKEKKRKERKRKEKKRKFLSLTYNSK